MFQENHFDRGVGTTDGKKIRQRGQQSNPVLAEDGIVGKQEGLALHRKEGILSFGPGRQR